MCVCVSNNCCLEGTPGLMSAAEAEEVVSHAPQPGPPNAIPSKGTYCIVTWCVCVCVLTTAICLICIFISENYFCSVVDIWHYVDRK